MTNTNRYYDNSKCCTVLAFRIVCYGSCVLSFSYFLNSVINYLSKNYSLVNNLKLDEIKQDFLYKAKVGSDLMLKFVLKDKMDAHTENHLKSVISRAGQLRGIALTFCK